MQLNGWDHALKVTSDGKGLVGHAGAILLRKAADQAGLSGVLSAALRKKNAYPLFDRGIVLVSVAVSIALGATSMSDIALLAHLAPVLGGPERPDSPPRPRAGRRPCHAGQDRPRPRESPRARLDADRRHRRGFPWPVIAGKELTGWVVIDMDATLVTAYSDKEGAAPTWRKGYSFHPLGAWCRNTRECLAMKLRPGNAGSNTFTDHEEVLAAALKQGPLPVPAQGHGPRRRRRRQPRPHRPPAGPFLPAQDHAVHLRLDDHAGRRGRHPAAPGPRVEARHRPGRQHRGGQGRRRDHRPDGQGGELARRTALDRPPREAVPPAGAQPHRLREGDRLAVLDHLHEHPRLRHRGVPGSHHPQYIDVVHREHAVVETAGVRTAKAMGLRGLPSKTWQVNAGWVTAANIAADLAAWTRLLGHAGELGSATPARIPSATGSGTSPRNWPPTPATRPSPSAPTGPGPKRS